MTLAARRQALRILYVDDDEKYALLLKQMLEGAGHGVILYPTPGQALAALDVSPSAVDLVITDYTLPEMTGFELISAVRAIGCGVRCVVISHDIESLPFERAVSAGVSLVLEKPASPRQFNDLIRRATDGLISCS